jgi:hypothetical protein
MKIPFSFLAKNEILLTCKINHKKKKKKKEEKREVVKTHAQKVFNPNF